MKRIFKWIDEYLEVALGIAILSVMTIVIFIQVLARYVFQNSLSWSEELARYLFIWAIYLGISYGCKMSTHIKLDIMTKILPKKYHKIFDIIGNIVFAIFAIYIAFTGWELVTKQGLLNRTSPALGLPMQVVYAAPVVGMALSAIRIIQNLFNCFKDGKLEKEMEAKR
ncbi:TRAP transporter small permease [Murdochiella vaginalis]|uniref:TRAP transporter small permease n=1 Tax=Murdochiella vaginalis TaxID=1852373 RepID=UPI0008FE2AA2|nr:TRAP transporter small permease [Murdochiella vaginalis]